jgi:hypothetical protein
MEKNTFTKCIYFILFMYGKGKDLMYGKGKDLMYGKGKDLPVIYHKGTEGGVEV